MMPSATFSALQALCSAVGTMEWLQHTCLCVRADEDEELVKTGFNWERNYSFWTVGPIKAFNLDMQWATPLKEPEPVRINTKACLIQRWFRDAACLT